MKDDTLVVVVNAVGTKYGYANAWIGSIDENKNVNYGDLAQGHAATGVSIAETFMKVNPWMRVGVAVWGIRNSIDSVNTDLSMTGTVQISTLMGLGANVASLGLAAIETTPLGTALLATEAVTEFGVRVYELKTKSGGGNVQAVIYAGNSDHPSDKILPEVEVISETWDKTLRAAVTDWTDARSLASVYRDLEYTNPAEFAHDIATYAPDDVDALDAWFGGWQAGYDATSGVGSNGTGSGVGAVDSGIDLGSSGGGGFDLGTGTGFDDVSDVGFDSSYDYDFGYDYGYDYGFFGGLWPVVVDLDGDGVEINPLTSSLTAFDADGDGYVERTAWVGKDDGLLMIDIGNDGKITEPEEIAFANWTPGDDTDLQALASTFDSNGDGALDQHDERFSEFRIWHDANSDGQGDRGELLSLEDAGIRSLSLTVKPDTTVELGDGSVVHGIFEIQRIDGRLVQGADVTLAYESRGIREDRDANGDHVFRLESGDLLKQRVLAAGETDFVFGGEEWIGAIGNATANRLDASAATWHVALDGGAGDDVLKGGSGNDWLIGGAGADVFEGGSGDDVLLADAADVAAQQQVGGIDGGAGRDLLLVSSDVAVDMDVDAIRVEAVRSGSGDDSLRGRDDSVNYVFDGGGGNDKLQGAGGDDLLSGGAGDDRLEGGAGDDVYRVDRHDGADRIFDHAEGEYRQRYSYPKEVPYTEQYSYYERVRRGSGKSATWVNELRTGFRTQTRIDDRIGYRPAQGEIDSGIDTLLFGAGITIHDLLLERIGDDMRVSLRSVGDDYRVRVGTTIEGWADTRNRIENFAFADGNLLDFSQIEQAQHGMAGADRLSGTESGDFLSGGSGDDSLSGNAGNDVLSAGAGNDQIDGGDGKDLLFSGSGNDMLAGGAADDYLIAEAGDDQLDAGAGDDVLAGLDGDDILAGGDGKDRLLGGEGGDLLLGGSGDDTYFYFRGDGHDELFDDAGIDAVSTLSSSFGGDQRFGLAADWIAQYRAASGGAQAEGGNDRLQFGPGIAVEDLSIQTSGEDLLITLRSADDASSSAPGDQLTIRQWSNAKNRIETFSFLDGRTLQMAEITHASSGSATDDVLNGSSEGDLLSGGTGNDRLSGLGGADYLIGGAGSDQLDGGEGNDDVHGGSGDDLADGGAGNDHLFGGVGQDTIDGGDGNDALAGDSGKDLLNGGRGNDVYRFNRGDGQETLAESALGTESVQVAYTYTELVEKITRSGKGTQRRWVSETRTGYRSELRAIEGGNDTLQFGHGIDIGDLLLENPGDDLRISLLPQEGGDAHDSVTVQGWNTSQYRIEHLQFSNGFAVDIGHLGGTVSGTVGNDVLDAGAGKASWLDGAAGNDTLNGGLASDVLHGGAGQDALNGGTGDDVYIFARGDGRDTISDSGSSAIGTGSSHPGGDKLLFGAGITIEDLVFSRQGRDMVVYLRDRKNPEAPLSEATDSVTIKEWSTAGRGIEMFRFFDGRDFQMAQLSSTMLGNSGKPTADKLSGSAASDWMDGFAGDDTLRARAGNDYLLGGSGNDTLYGDAGADLISGGSGNDLLSGGDGDDIAVGGDGSDTINGDAGKDFIAGGEGDDIVNGGNGNDVIIGDAGNDTFTASAGNDVYRFGFGDGNDTYIGSEQAGLAGTDIIQLEADVSKEQVWLERVGDDLVMKLLGSSDSMTFRDWYLSSDPAKNLKAPDDAKRPVYGFEAGGELLSYSKVNGLVAAMAGFAPGDGGDAYGPTASELPATVRTAVNNAWAAVA